MRDRLDLPGPPANNDKNRLSVPVPLATSANFVRDEGGLFSLSLVDEALPVIFCGIVSLLKVILSRSASLSLASVGSTFESLHFFFKDSFSFFLWHPAITNIP